jgi:hypothetical protein
MERDMQEETNGLSKEKGEQDTRLLLYSSWSAGEGKHSKARLRAHSSQQSKPCHTTA